MDERKQRQKSQYTNKDIQFIERQVCEFLKSNTKCTLMTEETIKNFIENCKDFNINETDIIQIINVCPTTLVEIYLIIDDCETKLGQDKAEELLALTKIVLLKNEKI